MNTLALPSLSVRLNNSIRAMPEGELDAYTADRWPELQLATSQ